MGSVEKLKRIPYTNIKGKKAVFFIVYCTVLLFPGGIKQVFYYPSPVEGLLDYFIFYFGFNVYLCFVKTNNMSSIELELYELLKIKLGEKETKALFDLVENKIDSKKDELATKGDIYALKIDIEKLRSELLVIKWMLGVVLAGIVSIIIKSFFA